MAHGGAFYGYYELYFRIEKEALGLDVDGLLDRIVSSGCGYV